MTLLFLACVQEAPLPDLGACADYPSGVYEYGQIGIGSCLAGPSDIVFLSDGKTIALSNANPWLNFSGGSIWTLDTSAVDFGAGRNVVSDLGDAVGAMDMPNFSGSLAYVPDEDLLLVTNRMSEDARTREAQDDVYFVDVSAPVAPSAKPLGVDGAGSLPVGYDPNAILYDDADQRAYVVDRTSHTIAMMDLAASPVALIDPGAGGEVVADDFVDADGSGSTAAFVTLETLESTEITPHHWDLQWGEGSLRMWLPNADGAYRVESSGDGTWTRAPLGSEVDLDNADGLFTAVGDPDFWTYTNADGVVLPRLAFSDQGSIWFAWADFNLVDWDYYETALLEPTTDSWDVEIGSPNLVIDQDGLTWLFYGGGDGESSSIGAASSTDATTFDRYGSTPLVSVDGASVSDPFVLWDNDAALWRMFFTVLPDGGSAYTGQATSADLVDWTVADFAAEGVAPAAGFFNGELRLYTEVPGRGHWTVYEARSSDGWSFADPKRLFEIEDSDSETAPGLALQVYRDESFALIDESGAVYKISLQGGDTLASESDGFTVRTAIGFVSGPDDVGDAGAGGIQVDSRVDDVVWGTATDADGLTSIVRGVWDGATIAWDTTPALEAGAGGTFDADGVSSAVVYDDGGAWVMYYGGLAGAVTTIGRATSTDGVTWTADAEPVLTALENWETQSMVPGSVQAMDDGSLRLWYSGDDGSEWRIGVAESTDGVAFTRVPGATYAWTFDSGTPGDWDDSGVRDPFVLTDGDTEHLWYAGYDGSAWEVGHASRVADGEWTTAQESDGQARPVIATQGGSFGAAGVVRPVVTATDVGWSVFYTGLDAEVGRTGLATGDDPERLNRDLRLPTAGDTWGFTSVPTDETGEIDLDQVIDDQQLTARGCAALAKDDARGFLYVACKLVPLVFVVDVRDDSTDTDPDLNYLDLEAVMFVTTVTDADSGFRDLIYDPTRDLLYGLMDDPEGVYALRVDDIVDDDDAAFIRDRILSTLPLPRSDERDKGVDTQASVGPGSMVMHPDGHHLFVTNYNDNSVTAFDLDLGPAGMQVGEARDVGENPYAIALSPDGALGVVGNYSGEVVDDVTTNSTLALLDTDPESATFMTVRTWVVNR